MVRKLRTGRVYVADIKEHNYYTTKLKVQLQQQ